MCRCADGPRVRFPPVHEPLVFLVLHRSPIEHDKLTRQLSASVSAKRLMQTHSSTTVPSAAAGNKLNDDIVFSDNNSLEILRENAHASRDNRDTNHTRALTGSTRHAVITI